MSWKRSKIVRECKECKAVICPGGRYWREPLRFGLLSILTRIRGVVEKSAPFCEECGRILEYEKEA
jgi:hypothetical protein